MAVAESKQAKTFVVVNEDVGVHVFAYDLTDRAYTVVGEVTAGVRKGSVFSKEASQTKIYRELWERAEKLGADAVIRSEEHTSELQSLMRISYAVFCLKKKKKKLKTAE